MIFKNYCYYYLNKIKKIEKKIKEIKNKIDYKTIIKTDNLSLFRYYSEKNKRVYSGYKYGYYHQDYMDYFDYMLKQKAYKILEYYNYIYFYSYMGGDPQNILQTCDFKIYRIFEEIFTIEERYNISGIISTKNIDVIKYFDNLLNFNKIDYILGLAHYNIEELLIEKLNDFEFNEEEIYYLLDRNEILNNLIALKFYSDKVNKTKYIKNVQHIKDIDCYSYVFKNNLVDMKHFKRYILDRCYY